MRSMTLAAALAVMMSLTACSELVLKRGEDGGVDVGINGVGSDRKKHDSTPEQVADNQPERQVSDDPAPPRKPTVRDHRRTEDQVRDHRRTENVQVRDHRTN